MNLSLVGVPLPLRLKPETPMSDEQLMTFCAANEILRVERDANGEVIVMTPTGAASGGRNMDISTDLNIWARLNGTGKAFDSSTGFTLPDGSMRSADVAWLLLSRWSALSKEQQRGFAPLCPDFVIELRSSTDSLADLRTKMKLWIANGVQLAWLIDPDHQAVTIYRPNHEPELLHHPTSVQGDGVMTGFELPMARIWC
ncbi:Uma2 family endonuclease [Granulicella arctica]|uniref:Uma2 family endonuclease n=1 Tax=Granulicella arctica TaxID=940613 RepID=UPI0021DF9C4A|nr:Uma2 family endonuclease [Granulicella arctica]